MSDEIWSLERVKEETQKGIKNLLGNSALEEEIDVSYITAELLNAYRSDAKEKDSSQCNTQSITQNVACFWGNNWVHVSENKWNYTNNHSGTGCDPVTESCLCGSGYRWSVAVNQMSKRVCPNGAPNAYMAWQ